MLDTERQHSAPGRRERRLGLLSTGLAVVALVCAGCSGSSSPTSGPSRPPVPPSPGSATGSGHAWPGPSTTGPREGVVLRGSGPLHVTQRGAVVSGLRVRGDDSGPAVVIDAPDVVVRDVQVLGTADGGGLVVRAPGAVIEDTEVVGGIGVSGVGVTIRRVNVHGPNDGIHVTSDTGQVRGVLVEDSWIHAPQILAGEHYDGIQVRGAQGVVLRGNRFDGGVPRPESSSEIFLEDANGGCSDVRIEGNYINGGGYSLYLSGRDVSVTGNTFGRGYHYGLLYPQGNPASWVDRGNVWAQNRAPVALR